MTSIDSPWQLKDPARTLCEIDARCAFEQDHVIVAAIDLADQSVTDARLALVGTLAGEHPHDSDLVRDLAEQMVPERWSVTRDHGGSSHVLITVVCRGGRVISTKREHSWLRAWRYANHFRGAFDGDVYIVTPDGWTGVMDHRAAFEPCLPATGPSGQA